MLAGGKKIQINDLWLKTCTSTAGVIGLWDQYSWPMAPGTDRQFEAILKENICHFLIEGLRGSCLRRDLSQLDLGNWLCWEDRWGQEEQVVLVETCEVLEVLSSGRAPRRSRIMSQRMQATQENKLIMSTWAGASHNKSPREAELLDQWDVSAVELSYMMDGLINHVFSIDSFKSEIQEVAFSWTLHILLSPVVIATIL